jgi:hypothetical protein
VRRRTRSVVVHAVADGFTCPALQQTERCGTDPCPVDCSVTGWAQFQGCSRSCGHGQQKRTRDVVAHESYGGQPCPPRVEWRECNPFSCVFLCRDEPVRCLLPPSPGPPPPAPPEQIEWMTNLTYSEANAEVLERTGAPTPVPFSPTPAPRASCANGLDQVRV